MHLALYKNYTTNHHIYLKKLKVNSERVMTPSPLVSCFLNQGLFASLGAAAKALSESASRAVSVSIIVFMIGIYVGNG
jgi:hypothetical protein